MAISATTPVPLVYDFYGFPQHYYEMPYDAPGAPELAAQVRGLMPANEPVLERPTRGLDHGAWVPLKAMYPDADIPVLQMSMPDLDPEHLFEVGRRLAPLRDEGMLIVGSGFLTHGLPYIHEYLWASPERRNGRSNSTSGRPRRWSGATSTRCSTSGQGARDAVRPPDRGAFRAAVRDARRGRRSPMRQPDVRDRGLLVRAIEEVVRGALSGIDGRASVRSAFLRGTPPAWNSASTPSAECHARPRPAAISRAAAAARTSSRRSSSPTRSGSTSSASASTTGRISPSRRRPSSSAAAAERTKRIRLTSAVTVLSSDDPVRVFQEFATLDLLSGGRAEIMAGRGSFIESFPLFGYDLDDYDEPVRREARAAARRSATGENVTWPGEHRAAIDGLGVYPRPVQDPLPVWIAVGGTPQSVVRAGMLGLPLALAIIGGEPERFAPFVELYREAAAPGRPRPGRCRSASTRTASSPTLADEAADDRLPGRRRR